MDVGICITNNKVNWCWDLECISGAEVPTTCKLIEDVLQIPPLLVLKHMLP